MKHGGFLSQNVYEALEVFVKVVSTHGDVRKIPNMEKNIYFGKLYLGKEASCHKVEINLLAQTNLGSLNFRSSNFAGFHLEINLQLSFLLQCCFDRDGPC